MKITVTGGAGFIGSHLVDLLIKNGHQVLVVDSLEKQVHGDKKPDYLNPKAKYIFDRYEKTSVMDRWVKETDVLVHLAALVGVGQSMYQIKKYVSGNTMATAKMLQYLLNKKNPIAKILVASSMSIYGEGEYFCEEHGLVYPHLRPGKQFSEHDWEMGCSLCDHKVTPVGTTEMKPLFPTSVYAVTKRDQEELVHAYGHSYDISTTALRFFNVYGERQSLSNPYTGVLAIFASRLLNNNPPVIYEDGKQSRDFIHVSDIVEGICAAITAESAGHFSLNLGTGKRTTIKKIATILRNELSPETGLEITSVFRNGDIRHCFADMHHTKRVLKFHSKVKISDGLHRYVRWLARQKPEDNFIKAQKELQKKGLV